MRLNMHMFLFLGYTYIELFEKQSAPVFFLSFLWIYRFWMEAKVQGAKEQPHHTLRFCWI